MDPCVTWQKKVYQISINKLFKYYHSTNVYNINRLTAISPPRTGVFICSILISLYVRLQPFITWDNTTLGYIEIKQHNLGIHWDKQHNLGIHWDKQHNLGIHWDKQHNLGIHWDKQHNLEIHWDKQHNSAVHWIQTARESHFFINCFPCWRECLRNWKGVKTELKLKSLFYQRFM